MPATIVSRTSSAPRGGRCPGRPGGGGESLARLALIVVGVVVAAVLLVMAAFWVRGRNDDGGGAATNDTTTQTIITGPAPEDPGAPGDPFPNGPTGVTDEGIPVGYSRDEAGTVAAVMSWSPYYGRTENPQVAFQLMDAVWTEETRDEERELEERARGRLLGQYQADGTLDALASQTTPLAWRTESYSDEQAVIEVWDAGIVSKEPVEGPQVVFRTVTWTLEWDVEADDWRVVTTSIESGPSPALDIIDRDDPSPRLDGFTYWDPADPDAGEWPVVRLPGDPPPASAGGG
ncbi:hypothetical protein BH24ACT4_BH24ACT4_00090 [soil metagenome]